MSDLIARLEAADAGAALRRAEALLDAIHDADCSDYDCEGRPSTGCVTECRVERRIKQLNVRIAALKGRGL